MDQKRRTELWYLLAAVGLIAGLSDPTGMSDPAVEGDRDIGEEKASQDTPISDQTAIAPLDARTAAPSGANVKIIRIEGMIYDFTLESLQRRVERALAAGASLIVIELDTYGGKVDSALEIGRYIKGKIPVKTIAWINSKAYSAGIMIAAACNEIVMSPSSATGDCAPIVPGQNLEPAERAKALSPILEEFRDSATKNNYEYPLFHAMCVLGVPVYLIENPETGARRLVNELDYKIMAQGARGKATGLGKLFGLGGSDNDEDDVGAVASELTEEEREQHRGRWKLVKQIHDGRTLLTLNQTRAQEVGLAKAIVRDESELRQYTGAASIVPVDQSWSEDLAGWLVHPLVRMVLVLALLLGAYVEFQTPGLGIAGAVALLSLITLLGAPFLVGLAEIWHLVVFFIGFLFLMIEFFVTPGFGLMGMTGIIGMLTGLILAVVPSSGIGPMPLPARELLNTPELLNRLQLSVLCTLLGIIGSGVGFYFLSTYLGSIPLLNKLVLHETSGSLLTSPALATGVPVPATSVSGDEVIGGGHIRVGVTGRVVAGLRPSGRAEIDGHVVDVVSQGSWIDSGQPVRVVEVHGNRIVVEVDG